MCTIPNKNKSKLYKITHGIPQSSVLGPLLFLLYINHLPLASKFKSILFAHDAKLYILEFLSYAYLLANWFIIPCFNQLFCILWLIGEEQQIYVYISWKFYKQIYKSKFIFTKNHHYLFVVF